MNQFDLEIKNSIASIQAQVTALGGAVDKTQASLARMGTQAKATAGQTFEVSKNMEKIGSAASVAGGPVAGLMTKLGGLAAFNPMALAAGAAIGALTAGVYKLVDALREANAERERMAAPIGNEATTAAVAEARAGLKPEELRAKVAPEPGESPAEIATAGAVSARRWIADMPEWAQAEAGKPADIGEAMVTQQDRIRQLAYDMSPEVRAAERIERRQAAEAGYKAEIADRAMRVEAGQSPRPLSEGAAMYILQQGKSDESDEFRKLSDELKKLREQMEKADTGPAGQWHMSEAGKNLIVMPFARDQYERSQRSERARIDAMIAEKASRQLALIEAARSASERSQ